MKKKKCTNCLKVNGRRLCKIMEDSLVCSPCCFEIRNESCKGCSHYSQSEKFSRTKMKKSHSQDFIAEIRPKFDETFDKALTYLENDNIAKAEELITELMENHPDLYIVYYGMGLVQVKKGNYAESITYFDKCLEIFPAHIESWFNKGTAHNKLHEQSKGIKAYQKVVQYGDRNMPIVEQAYKFLLKVKDITHRMTGLSLDTFLQAMDKYDESFIKMQNEEYENAINGFRDVLKINKNHTQSYGHIGLCYAFLGNKQEALSAYNKALALDPKYEPAIRNRTVLLKMKDKGKPEDCNMEIVDYYKDIAKEECGK